MSLWKYLLVAINTGMCRSCNYLSKPTKSHHSKRKKISNQHVQFIDICLSLPHLHLQVRYWKDSAALEEVSLIKPTSVMHSQRKWVTTVAITSLFFQMLEDMKPLGKCLVNSIILNLCWLILLVLIMLEYYYAFITSLSWTVHLGKTYPIQNL